MKTSSLRDAVQVTPSSARGGKAAPSQSFSFEERLQAAEARIAQIESLLPPEILEKMGDFTQPKYFDPVKYKAALAAFKGGDRGKKLDEYVKSGGMIPV